jgi:hypothetical protein
VDVRKALVEKLEAAERASSEVIAIIDTMVKERHPE